jgi:hypothetical protein
MKKKTNNKKQIVGIIGLSVGILLGASSCGSFGEFATGYSQGYSQGSEGRRFIGSASSENDCYAKATAAGCGNSYVYYSNTGNCFCK